MVAPFPATTASMRTSTVYSAHRKQHKRGSTKRQHTRQHSATAYSYLGTASHYCHETAIPVPKA
eukprot:6196469-Pleurochrysis_carterae.AAC.3